MSETRHCGECLMNDVEIVALDANGKCPRCGADYGPMPAPKTIRIWADTRGAAVCRGCPARIEWATVVESGKRMCFDEIVTVETTTDTKTGRPIIVALLDKNHWATCPDRERFHQRRR